MTILYRRNGRRDLLPGLITGTVTGLAAGATFACLLKGLDGIFRLALPIDAPGMAIVGWSVWGGVGGIILQFAGTPGARALSTIGGWFGRLAVRLRLQRLAAFVTGSGVSL